MVDQKVHTRGSHLLSLFGAAALAATVGFACLALAASQAKGAKTAGSAAAPAPGNTVYWGWATFSGSTPTGGGIAFSALSGKSGGQLAPKSINHPVGSAIDSATGRIYWGDYPNAGSDGCYSGTGGNTIDSTSLATGKSGKLHTGTAPVDGPAGVAIDPATRKIYWANELGNTIAWANLNGSGGGTLNISGATPDCPVGIALDPAVGKLFWGNVSGNSISWAYLNGSGGGQLTTSATVSSPYGLAIDPKTNQLFWANATGSISYSNLNGTGAGELNTSGATVELPNGVAIDPAAGRVYWANGGATTTVDEIAYASLRGIGGANLPTPKATAPAASAKFPTLLEIPRNLGKPRITGGTKVGATLSCSRGTWAPDLTASFLFRAPQTYGYSWRRNGKPIPSATSSQIKATSAGSYVCVVTARNHAGPKTAVSPAHSV